MVDTVSASRRSYIMRAIPQKNTRPEMVIRRMVHAMGARYRLHSKALSGRPDLVFPSRRLCIFVHGCFWHRHRGCRLASVPASNVEFWSEKFRSNIERDKRKETELRNMGWRVEIIWECETRDLGELKKRLRELLFPDV